MRRESRICAKYLFRGKEVCRFRYRLLLFLHTKYERTRSDAQNGLGWTAWLVACHLDRFLLYR